MKCDVTTSGLKIGAGKFQWRSRAFTLIEMLLVITIIAIVASIGIPHLKGWGQADAMTAATRQLMDDLSLARLKAINNRTTVYVVFISPDIMKIKFKPEDSEGVTNLYSGQYTTYALFSKRQAGEQPGRENPRYLTPWKSLPEKVFIATRKFIRLKTGQSRFNSAFSETNRPFAYELIPFPHATNTPVLMPCIAFNSRGQLISEDEDPDGAHRYHEAVIPLASGSVFYARNPDGTLKKDLADPVETPPGNSQSNYHNIRIDWLTGRARLERREIQ